MTQRRQTAIKQGAVTDVMSHLSKLPERGRDPGVLVSLPEIFRTKEYMAEIKGALKKGYTFGDLAEIITERCGVAVSARQLKYHCTRAKNLAAKDKPGGQSKPGNAPKNGNPSGIPAQNNSEGEEKANTEAAPDPLAEDALKPANFVQSGYAEGTSETEGFFTGYAPANHA
jgi:hypothetical protein